MKVLGKTSPDNHHKQLSTVLFKFSVVNPCGRESLGDRRRDCSHNFFSERDSEHTNLLSIKVSEESFGQDVTKNCVRLATNNVLSQVTGNFIVKHWWMNKNWSYQKIKIY